MKPSSGRADILDAVEAHVAARDPRPFIPGETPIPASGKIVNAADARALVDASLDLWLTAGRFAADFEPALAARTGVKYARATVSGSAANLLAFSALTSHKLHERRIRSGDEIVTVAAGFPTTVAPIVQNGCTPVFCDVTLPNGDVSIAELEAAIGPKTRAIMIAHTLGHPYDLDAVEALAKKHDLWVVEDCCDAFGATWNGRGVGTVGDAATLSFYPAHHITTGEGGAVFMRSKAIATLVESFRDWGRDCWCPPGEENTCGKRFDWTMGDLPTGYDHKYIYSHLGYNLKMTDMQAALGLSQLAKLDGFIAARRRNHAALAARARDAGLEEVFHLPLAHELADPSWFGFLLTLRDDCGFARSALIRWLDARKIGTRLLFAGNLTKQPCFKHVAHRTVSELTVTDKMMRDSVWIGVWPGIGEAEIDYMIGSIADFVRGARAVA